MTDVPRDDHVHRECYACPVGSFFNEFRAAEPEALDHLLNASYELLEVARVAIEAAERAIDEQRTRAAEREPRDAREPREPRAPTERASRTSRVRRIDIA